MRILHIDSELTWRGGQNQIKLLMHGCHNHGDKVYLAAPRTGALVHALAGAFPLADCNLRHGMDLTAARAIAKFCREEMIDIVDAHSAKAHNIGLMVKCLAPKIKLVVHRRVDYVPSRLNLLNFWKYRSRKVDRYVAISDAIAKVLIDFGVPASRVSVVKSSTTPPRFKFADKAAAKSFMARELVANVKIPWVLSAGALTQQKDFPNLLRALARLKKSGTGFVAVIAGAGKLEQSLRFLAEGLSLFEPDLFFLGFREDIADLLQAADIFALSSEFEGLGTIILDALHSGCAVAATNVGGIPEMIEHGRTGLLSPIHDDDALAQNLTRLIASESLRGLLASAGQKMLEDHFTVAQMVEGNRQVYLSLLNGGI